MMVLSIITINYNNREGLAKTIRSVANQTYRDFEYIVIDGASTDGSVDVIKENDDNIDYWVSEKDSGIYHAMNKGTKVAHGNYCLFLNSGDQLIDNHVIEHILSHQFSADIVSGRVKHPDGKIIKPPRHVTMKTFIVRSMPHQSTLIKRELLLDNPYDERLRIGGDWRFFVQVLIYKNASYESIPDVISLFDTSGLSNTESERRSFEKELCRDILPIRIEEDYKYAYLKRVWKWRFKKVFDFSYWKYAVLKRYK